MESHPLPASAVPVEARAAAPADPFLVAQTSLRSRLARGLWSIVELVLFRPSPRPLHRWRCWLLRSFGARLGRDCRIYPRARIWAPWRLECEDVVAIADDAIVYNPGGVRFGSHSIVSEGAYLCGATHDYCDPGFPMIDGPIVIGRYAWIGARAAVQMGVSVGEGAVLGLGAIATRDLEPWSVYVGAPARRIKARPRLY